LKTELPFTMSSPVGGLSLTSSFLSGMLLS